MSFEDKVVVITGAAQGIGKEIALQFCKKKASVVFFDVNKDILVQTEKELSEYSSCSGMAVDVSSTADVEKNINKIIDKYGRVDILVNNAGITRDNLILKLSENEWDSVLAVNLKGAFNCIKAVSRPMVKQRYGRIINISSVIGIIGNPGQINYAASKAGLIAMTRTLAKELGSRNITVNAVAPGYIETAMTKSLNEKVKEAMLSRIPLGRFGKPQDVARAVVFLASAEADYINGQVLVVDGGKSGISIW
ncbi:MAG: 3-oxoacyl-[acyl-carrier-protein] reductase [Candidatus Omnitrophota bacterium]